MPLTLSMTAKKIIACWQKIQIPPIWLGSIVSFYLICDLLIRNTGGLFGGFSRELWFILYVLTILSAQQIVLWFVFSKLQKQRLAFIMAAFFFAVNFFSFYLTLYHGFLLWPKSYRIFSIFGSAAIFFLILLYSKPWIFKLTCFVLILSIMGNLNIHVFAKKTHISSKPLPENFIYQDFVRKPNVYLLSFDALIPESLAKYFLKLETGEKIPYIETLKAQNAQIIPNAFADYAPTAVSLNSLLALDLDWWKTSHSTSLITGLQWNPIYEIFKTNGYKIQIMDELYRPNKSADSVDAYTNGTDSCSFVRAIHVLGGYCKFRYILIQNIFLERAQAAAQSDTPYLTFAYILTPGHTPSAGYNPKSLKHRQEYKEFFLKESQNTAEIIKKLIHTIRADDPDGIIVIFGDHGAKLSGAVYEKAFGKNTPAAEAVLNDSPYSRADIFLDLHGIFMTILDDSGCRIQQGKLTTINDMMINLLECLTGGKSVLKQRKSNESRFIDFIYE